MEVCSKSENRVSEFTPSYRRTISPEPVGLGSFGREVKRFWENIDPWGWEVKVVVTVFESEKCIGPDGQICIF